MSKNHKMVIAGVVGIVMLWIVTLLPFKALAQDDGTAPEKLLIGTMVAPPFAMKTADGRWEGLSIRLLKMIAHDLGVEYELIEYNNLGQIVGVVEKGELDVFIALVVTESHETILDLSHPFLTSGLAIAAPAVVSGHSLFFFTGHFVDRFASLDFLLLIGILILLSLAAGAIVLVFEARRNPEMFGGGAIKGLGQGIWWAMVTMTTVGYGDKAPKTLGGRIAALIWMFASIFLVASFTAAITASLTVGELSGKVRGLRDLHVVRVGSVAHSEALNFLTQRGIAVQSFKNEHAGLQAIVDGKIDAFVYNQLVLKYLSRTDFPGRVHVLPEIFDHNFVSIAMPQGSALREPLNRALLEVIAKDDWIRLVERYISPSIR